MNRDIVNNDIEEVLEIDQTEQHTDDEIDYNEDSLENNKENKQINTDYSFSEIDNKDIDVAHDVDSDDQYVPNYTERHFTAIAEGGLLHKRVYNKFIEYGKKNAKKGGQKKDYRRQNNADKDLDEDDYDQSNKEVGLTNDNRIIWSDTKRIQDDIDLYSKQVEQVRDMHHIYRDALTECYKVVSEYIIRHKRILVGGMAIDHALRAKGSFLYETEKVDYDFISPDFHKDAYNIGQELAKKFSGISIIGARHISTMRVRFEFIPVADITYVPKNLYDIIPTIEFMGIRNIHPHFQMIDQHRAMTHALENPPQETIISSRYEKDVKRYILLAQFYPVPIQKGLKVKLNHYEIPYSYIYNNCLGGYISAIYWLKKIGVETSANVAFSKKKLHLSIPEDGKILILTDDFKSLLHKFSGAKIKYYNAFLDKVSRYIEVTTSDTIYEIHDNKGEKIVAEDLGKIHILGMSGTMTWLLLQGLFYKNEWCLYIYKHLKIAFIKEGHGKFLPKFTFYGKYNWSDSYLLHLNRQLNKLGYKKIDNSMVPRNFHPNKGDIIPPDAYDFDPTQSPFYQQDSKECKPFDETELPN